MSAVHVAVRVVDWQRLHGRNHLPWSGQSAYCVWLSEVMLQQTRVATVLPYYAAFLHRFPNVADLAAAPLDEVIAMWAGLGYYSRARHLHRCAQQVCALHGGVFPSELAQLQALPGIGPSTAAAIASLAQGQRAAILDGNVKRVLARHGGIHGWPGKPSVAKQLWQVANEYLIPTGFKVAQDHHRRYTQGLMDLGATVCSVKQPRCDECPIAHDCVAFATGQISAFPAARPKKTIPIQSRCALVVHTATGVWLMRRPESGLWGGLLSLPEAPSIDALSVLSESLGAGKALNPWHIHHLKHTFTHYHLHWVLWGVAVKPSFTLPSPWVFAQWDDLPHAGVPKAVLKVMGR